MILGHQDQAAILLGVQVEMRGGIALVHFQNHSVAFQVTSNAFSALVEDEIAAGIHPDEIDPVAHSEFFALTIANKWKDFLGSEDPEMNHLFPVPHPGNIYLDGVTVKRLALGIGFENCF